MTRQLIVIAVTSLAISRPVALTAQDSDLTPSSAVMQAVEAVFPKELLYPKDQESGNVYRTCAAVFSKNVDGTPNLIATAYSGDGIEVDMVAYTPGVAKIISTVPYEQFWMNGGVCGLGIVNLTDPEHPHSPLAKTIAVSSNYGPDWLFTWNGANLQNITAVRVDDVSKKGIPESMMQQIDIVDIDHAGTMQIVGNNGDGDKVPREDGILASPTKTLFRHNGKIYAPAKTLIAIQEFEPNLPSTPDELAFYKSGDARWVMGIDIHQTPAPHYQLTIVNGDRDGSNRVTSAKVEVNGETVIQSTETNQNVEMLTRTIQMQKENDIKVTVDGPPGSHVYVVVE